MADLKSINENREMGYKEKLGEIAEYLRQAEEAQELSHQKDKYGYIVPQLRKLTDMITRCDQYETEEIDPDGDWYFTEKVFKVNRYIPNYILAMNNIESVAIGGLFAILPCFVLPANKVKAATDNHYNSVMDPEKYGLPSSKMANYSCIRYASPTAYVVLARIEGFSITSDWITLQRHIEYLYTK